MKEHKIKLEFGNPEHIKYSKLKPLSELKVWDFHECDCEDCQKESSTCPHCKSHKEPELYDEDEIIMVKCKDCERIALDDDCTLRDIKKIVKDFELINKL